MTCRALWGAALPQRCRGYGRSPTGLLPVRERVLGPEDPHTLLTRANIATWTGEAGDPAAARTSTRRCCPCLSGSSSQNTRAP
jgi:hypothetical protein